MKSGIIKECRLKLYKTTLAHAGAIAARKLKVRNIVSYKIFWQVSLPKYGVVTFDEAVQTNVVESVFDALRTL
jgi:hypothetical protein